jgi:hypothetical protein
MRSVGAGMGSAAVVTGSGDPGVMVMVVLSLFVE